MGIIKKFVLNLKFVFNQVVQIDPKIIIVYILLLILGVVIPTLGSYIPKIIIDIIENYSSPQILILTVSFCFGVMILIKQLQNYLTFKSNIDSKKIARKFDYMFSDKVMSLNFEMFESAYGKNVYQKAKNSLSHYGAYSYIRYFFEVFKNLFGLLVYCIIISKVNILIIPIIIGVELLGGVFAMFIRQFENKLKNPKAVVERKLNYITNISKNFSAAKDIRLYSLEVFFNKETEKYLNEKKYLIKKGQRYYAQNDIFATLLSLLITGGAYSYLIYKLFKSDLGAGDIVLYIGIIINFTSWLEGVVDSIDSLLRANHAITDIRDFLEINLEEQDGKLPISKEVYDDWEIEFVNVSYKYAGSDHFALKNINLKISSKEHLAIVGYNGAGKTTLIKLMCGLYKPTEGEIKLNGININKFATDDYYSLFALVFQDIRFLPESILSNITMKEKDESDEGEAMRCVEKVGLKGKIESLPYGLDTKLMKNINEKATELSGGEAQKLMMARTLYKNTPIVILDEPTAALDPIAENQIYLRYGELVRGKTSIFISHRLSSTRFCDRIILLENSEIFEIGTHTELMQKEGKYAELYKIQSYYYSKENEANRLDEK